MFHERTRPAGKLLSSNTLRKERGTVQTMNVNAPAITASATPACAARADRAATMSAPLASFPESEAWVGEADPELEEELAAGDKTIVLVGAGLETAAAGVAGELEPEAGTLEVLFELEFPLPPGRYDGGATALDGSVRAPVPQGIGWPPGWVAFGAGTVPPVAEAMVKRPVQRRSVAFSG